MEERPSRLASRTALGAGAGAGDNSRGVQRGCERIALEGQRIAALVEVGQSQTPLTDHFEELLHEPGSSSQNLVLAGLDDNARGAAMSWFSGSNYNLFSVQANRALGMVEVHLQEQGFVLEKPDGTRTEYDQVDQFLDAIRQSDLVKAGDGSNWADPLRLQLAAPKGMRGIKLLMPETLESLVENPANFAQAMTRSSWLVVAGMADSVVSEATLQAVTELANTADVVWLLIFEGKSDEEPSGSRPEREWWQTGLFKGEIVTLPALTVEMASGEPKAESIVSEEICRPIFLRHLVRRLSAAIQLLQDRHAKREREFKQKFRDAQRAQKKLETKSRGLTTGTKETVDALRTDLDELTNGIVRGLKEANRKDFAPRGELTQLAESLAAEVAAGHLERRPSLTTVKLGLSIKFLDDLRRGAAEAVWKRLYETAGQIRGKFDQFSQRIRSDLDAVQGQSASVQLPVLREQEVWEDIEQYLILNQRYEVELPKRGLGGLIWRAIRSSFSPILMLTMLLGYLGLKPMLKETTGFGKISELPVQYTLIIGALLMFWSIHSVTRKVRLEDQERKNNELRRMRDGLEGELTRMMEKFEREKLDAIDTHLSDLRKDVQGILRTQFEQATVISQKSLESELQHQKTLLANLQNRAKDMQQVGREVVKLGQEYQKLDLECGRLLRDAAAGMKKLMTP